MSQHPELVCCIPAIQAWPGADIPTDFHKVPFTENKIIVIKQWFHKKKLILPVRVEAFYYRNKVTKGRAHSEIRIIYKHTMDARVDFSEATVPGEEASEDNTNNAQDISS